MMTLHAFTRIGFMQKSESITLNIYQSLQYARSEAIRQNRFVVVCGTEDNQICSHRWSRGFMVFIPLDEKNTILRILRTNTFSEPANIHSGKQRFIVYSGDGRALMRATIWVQIGFVSEKIVIYDSGRARISKNHTTIKVS